jgi:hypothetical protein
MVLRVEAKRRRTKGQVEVLQTWDERPWGNGCDDGFELGDPRLEDFVLSTRDEFFAAIVGEGVRPWEFQG